MPSARSASNAHTPTQDPCRAHVLPPHSPARCSGPTHKPHTSHHTLVPVSNPLQHPHTAPLHDTNMLPTVTLLARSRSLPAISSPLPPASKLQHTSFPLTHKHESNISGPKCTIAKAKYLQRRASNRVAVQKSRHKKRQRVRELEAEKARFEAELPVVRELVQSTTALILQLHEKGYVPEHLRPQVEEVMKRLTTSHSKQGSGPSIPTSAT